MDPLTVASTSRGPAVRRGDDAEAAGVPAPEADAGAGDDPVAEVPGLDHPGRGAVVDLGRVAPRRVRPRARISSSRVQRTGRHARRPERRGRVVSTRDGEGAVRVVLVARALERGWRGRRRTASTSTGDPLAAATLDEPGLQLGAVVEVDVLDPGEAVQLEALRVPPTRSGAGSPTAGSRTRASRRR